LSKSLVNVNCKSIIYWMWIDHSGVKSNAETVARVTLTVTCESNNQLGTLKLAQK